MSIMTMLNQSYCNHPPITSPGTILKKMLKAAKRMHVEKKQNTGIINRSPRRGRMCRRGSGHRRLQAVSILFNPVKVGESLPSSNLVTEGQNFFSNNHGTGYAAASREYGRSHSLVNRSRWVCGDIFNTLPSRGCSPLSTAAISFRIEMRASQNRSSSALFSDSVGSIISVLATGQDMVGAWKP